MKIKRHNTIAGSLVSGLGDIVAGVGVFVLFAGRSAVLGIILIVVGLGIRKLGDIID